MGCDHRIVSCGSGSNGQNLLDVIGYAAAVLLVLTGTRDPWLLASLPLLALIWISTGFVQIPLHNTLTTGFDAHAHRRLVTTNWWRTAAWSARGICIMMMS